MHGSTEMKKLLIAFFMILIVFSAYAENWIKFKSDVVENAINQLVASENRQAAADEYQKNMDQINGNISVIGIYKVCIASGFNIQTNDGYNLCRNFLNVMISESNFGTGSATQKTCTNQFNGIWTLSADGKKYQCVGRDGYELLYTRACNGEEGKCIKQFASLQTQGSNGREFINAYGELHGLSLTCHANIETRRGLTSPLGQDYIKCSAGGKAYEFEFDDLNQTLGDKSSSSENTAICELYGGKIIDTGDKYTEDTWQSCDISSELCNGAVHDLALRTGHTNMYQGYCRLSREIKTVSVIGLKQIEGIDSRIFYNAGVQMRMDTAKPMAEEYLRTKFPNETYIVCDSNPKELNDGLGIDIDYVISCTVGTKQVDFIFDDLSETLDSDAMTGIEAMQCIINGGTFKGETCRGPTKEECKKLDSVLRAKGADKGARYDDEARACILGNAESTYKRDVAIGYITGAVVIVGGAIVTIGTGGAAGPVVIKGVALLAGDIAINYAMDANHQRLTNKAAKKFVDFVTDAQACKTEQCAIDVLEKHYATLSGVMSDLNTEDQAVVDETMNRLIGLIQTEFVACGKDNTGKTVYARPADCAMQSSRLTLLDYIDPYSEVGLVIGSVIYDPGYVVARFIKLNKVTKVANVVDGITDAERTANKLDDAADASLRLKREELRDALKSANKLDDGGTMQIPQGEFAADYREVPRNRLETAQGVDLGNGYKMLQDGKISGPVDYSIRDTELDEMIEAIKMDARRPNTPENIAEHVNNRASLVSLYQDLPDEERIQQVAEISRANYLDIIASNDELAAKALDFENLSVEERAEFAQDIVKEFDLRFGIGSEYNNASTATINIAKTRDYNFQAYTQDGVITFREDYLKNYSLDDFMNTLSHENMHDIDTKLPGFGSGTAQNVEFGIATGLTSDYEDLYKKNVLEAAGYGVGDYVGNNFERDLINLIEKRLK